MALLTRTIDTTSRGGRSIGRVNAALWVTQGALALIFLFAGSSKLMMSAEQMTSQSDLDLPILFMRFIGVCEVAGAFGLILPSVSRIRTGLTPLAACGLIVIMAGATTVTAIAGPAALAVFPLCVGVAAAFVAFGRTSLCPLGR